MKRPRQRKGHDAPACVLNTALPLALVVALALALAQGLVSCSQGLLPTISRTLGDPSVVAPTARSFDLENAVTLTWSSDPNADTYVLQRAVDAALPTWQTLCSGSATSYTDSSCTDQERYLYRLIKTRGSASFGPSGASMGVASATCQDSYEPNDTEASATVLDFEKIANLYYYASSFQQDGSVLTVQDKDWYAVTVPPRSTAEILITESTLAPETQTTHIRFYQKGQSPQAVNQSVPIDVVNSSYATQTFLCELFPDPAQFQTAGGMVIGYSIKVSATFSN